MLTYLGVVWFLTDKNKRSMDYKKEITQVLIDHKNGADLNDSINTILRLFNVSVSLPNDWEIKDFINNKIEETEVGAPRKLFATERMCLHDGAVLLRDYIAEKSNER